MKMKKTASQIWNEAPSALEDVDNAFVFQHYACQEFPTFQERELKTAPKFLGQGGFSNVFEIVEINLVEGGMHDTRGGRGGSGAINNNKKELKSNDSKITASNHHENQQGFSMSTTSGAASASASGGGVGSGNSGGGGGGPPGTGGSSPTSGAEAAEAEAEAPSTNTDIINSDTTTNEKKENNDDDDNNSISSKPITGGGTTTTTTTTGGTPTATTATTSASTTTSMDEHHYDVSEARTIMAQRAMRFGSSRYALKRLRPDLSSEEEYARGALDLAIEIKFMSVLQHPNIVKMRAYSETSSRLSVDTFIVMDRLYGTLEDRMEKWAEQNTMLKSDAKCCASLLGRTSPEIQKASTDLLKERLLVSYDMTVAFAYIHSLRLVYRDIKPENVGFDIRGDVKIFDFGLSKSLDGHLKSNKGYGYNLTGFTGSIPYMAPEIALRQPYDKECDVFSFSMLLWEIASFEFMYPDYTIRDYYVKVCKHNERPPIPTGRNSGWPAILKSIVEEGWDSNPQKRPSMKRVGQLIRGLLTDLSFDTGGDDSIVNRTQHMMNKSRRSLHGESFGLTGSRSKGGGDGTTNVGMSSRGGRRGGVGVGVGVGVGSSSRRGGTRGTSNGAASNNTAENNNNNKNNNNTSSMMVPTEAQRRSGKSSRSIHNGHETMDD